MSYLSFFSQTDGGVYTWSPCQEQTETKISVASTAKSGRPIAYRKGLQPTARLAATSVNREYTTEIHNNFRRLGAPLIVICPHVDCTPALCHKVSDHGVNGCAAYKSRCNLKLDMVTLLHNPPELFYRISPNVIQYND